MGSCEMCGKDERTSPVMVEGVVLNVCEKCASFGKAVKRQPMQRSRNEVKKEVPLQKEIILSINDNFSAIIREKREKMGLKQQEFAKFLSEKESMIHKIESGAFVPSIELARKIEKQLGVALIEEKELEPEHVRAKNATFTIGDVLKIK